MTVAASFYFVMLVCYLLAACSFLIRGKKGVGLDGRGGREDLGGVEGGGTVVRGMLCDKRISFC